LRIVINSSEIRYFENIGHAHSPIFEERFETANPFGEFGKNPKIRIYCPRFIDVDNDGDWDAFIRSVDLNNMKSGTRYFENIGDINQPQFEERTNTANPFAEMELEHVQKPTLADLDGDLDILTGTRYGTLRYYENIGSMTTPQFVEHVDHPLDWVKTSRDSVPHFADFDQDGDWDILVGETFYHIWYYENTGNATQPVFQPPRSNNPLHGANSRGLFNVVDIDND